MTRLVQWNVDVLSGFLKMIVAKNQSDGSSVEIASSGWLSSSPERIMDELQPNINLPPGDTDMAGLREKAHLVELEPDVLAQLQLFVSGIGAMYRNHHFHNFEHASHVTLSVSAASGATLIMYGQPIGANKYFPIIQVSKLMGRILTNKVAEEKGGSDDPRAASLGSYLSDPLTSFACVFSALIHDVDHPGVSNSQLVKENASIAKLYHKKSVAEQHSIDVAWKLLQEPQYGKLRETIHPTKASQARFRQLVVNLVLATDLWDTGLRKWRHNRWQQAFSTETGHDKRRFQATVVLEYLMQASDISHTMQHWHVYRKWNERLFSEIYQAQSQTSDNQEDRRKRLGANWYPSELYFFDNIVLPLAGKLQECGVFGVSGKEYLTYALKNRQEWERRGKDVVAEMAAARVLPPDE